MKIKHEGKEYIVRERACKKRKCFVPFAGNNFSICRLYELGQCPPEFREEKGEENHETNVLEKSGTIEIN